jgi:hypothetical protein
MFLPIIILATALAEPSTADRDWLEQQKEQERIDKERRQAFEEEQEQLRQRNAAEQKQLQEEQYRRNIYAVQAAFGRQVAKTKRETIHGYAGRLEFAMLIPTEDGASPVIALQIGLSGWGSEEKDRKGENLGGFGVPISFGWGYRTPWLIGYGGLSFGLGFDRQVESSLGAYSAYGTFANLGVDLMGLRLLGDARGEYRAMKYDASRWQLTYGALISVDL